MIPAKKFSKNDFISIFSNSQFWTFLENYPTIIKYTSQHHDHIIMQLYKLRYQRPTRSLQLPIAEWVVLRGFFNVPPIFLFRIFCIGHTGGEGDRVQGFLSFLRNVQGCSSDSSGKHNFSSVRSVRVQPYYIISCDDENERYSLSLFYLRDR